MINNLDLKRNLRVRAGGYELPHNIRYKILALEFYFYIVVRPTSYSFIIAGHFQDMIKNDREVIFIKYSTEENWTKDLPKENWLCILVDNDRPRRYLDEVISKIIANDVCYVCTIGKSSEKTHDLIDDEIQFREVDVDPPYLPKHQIMTVWDIDMAEGVWFAFYAAHSADVVIDKVVVLDMTDGLEMGKVKKIIEELKADG